MGNAGKALEASTCCSPAKDPHDAFGTCEASVACEGPELGTARHVAEQPLLCDDVLAQHAEAIDRHDSRAVSEPSRPSCDQVESWDMLVPENEGTSALPRCSAPEITRIASIPTTVDSLGTSVHESERVSEGLTHGHSAGSSARAEQEEGAEGTHKMSEEISCKAVCVDIPSQAASIKESAAFQETHTSEEKVPAKKKRVRKLKPQASKESKSESADEQVHRLQARASSLSQPHKVTAESDSKESVALQSTHSTKERASSSSTKRAQTVKSDVSLEPKSEVADKESQIPKRKLAPDARGKIESKAEAKAMKGSHDSGTNPAAKSQSQAYKKPKAKARSVAKSAPKSRARSAPPRTTTAAPPQHAPMLPAQPEPAPLRLQPTPAPPPLQVPGGLSKSLTVQFTNMLAQINHSRQLQWQTFENQRLVLAQLDSRTRVPHLLIELRSLGFIEICGKDTGGIYQRLGEWLCKTFGCQPALYVLQDTVAVNTSWFGGCSRVQHMGMAQEWEKVCDANYVCGQQNVDGTVTQNGTFQARGHQGENNMGKLTMMIVNFMTNECGWGLQLCDGGNLGLRGQIREQQIKFKAPHPLNLIAPHLMIELRQVGYIEINGANVGNIHHRLDQWLTTSWEAKRVQDDHSSFCDIKYQCKAFKSRGISGENNMGLCTMLLIDFMVKKCAWTLITCNGGNYGRTGTMREQQLVFRNDEHVQHGENHVMVELRDAGYVEVNGLDDAGSLRGTLEEFTKSNWGCQNYKPNIWEKETYCDAKFTTPAGFYYRAGLTNNLGQRTIQLSEFMSKKGWGLTLCNGGSISDVSGFHIKREQQILFTKARPGENVNLPLLMLELRAVPSDSSGNYNGFVELNGPNTNDIYTKLIAYMQSTMLAQAVGPQAFCDLLFHCGCFRLRNSSTDPRDKSWNGLLNGESNFGRYSMRLCDFLVDHIGEWDLLVCNGDSQDQVFRKPKDSYGNDTQSVNCREQQLVFRYRPGGRAVFMASEPIAAPLGRPVAQAPKYWNASSCSGSSAHEIIPATAVEKKWMQELLDSTYKKKATRDRMKIPLADRLVLVSALRSEHPALWEKYVHRRNEVRKKVRSRKGSSEEQFVVPKTMAASTGLAGRCVHPRVGNPTNEAYLLHGTNPTSAQSILATSFKIDFAGQSAGTMFGPGVYLAEASSKADEYAADENTGGAYDGLFAMLVCRTILGRAYVTEKSGDYRETCLSGNFEVVVGDREKAVGTYREFVVFHEGSIYPEYVALYRREYDDPADARRAKEARALAKTPAHAMRPSTPMPAAPPLLAVPKLIRMQVQVPKHSSPGDQLHVKTPSGTLVQVTVPVGVSAGQTFLVDAPE